LIIDCHGHYTTAPPALGAWRDQQIAGLNDPAAAPRPADLRITDDQLRESIEANQLRSMDERGIDLTCPMWHVLDLTPQGRGDWYAQLAYPT